MCVCEIIVNKVSHC